MPRAGLGRNLHLCFSKIRRPLADQSSPAPLIPDDHCRPLPATAAKASILIKNFNSLYDHPAYDSTTHLLSCHSDDHHLSSPESDTETATPDFATIFASQRFFFSSPGQSNSIIESSETPFSSSGPTESDALIGGSIAVPTYSPDPYTDFRRSMQEMVDSRDLMDVRANWDFLHELFLCYLALNPKNTHKFIVGAFADLLVSLMSPVAGGSSGRRRESEFAGAGR